MRSKRLIAAILLTALALCATAYAAGNTPADSLITLSYLDEIFVRPINDTIKSRANQLLADGAASADKAIAALRAKEQAKLDAALADSMYQRVSVKVGSLISSLNTGSMSTLTLKKGDRVVGKTGAGVVLISGTAQTCGNAGTDVVNITAGKTMAPGTAVAVNAYSMIMGDNGSGITITSDSATVYVRDGARMLPAYTAANTKYADALLGLKLFLGSNRGYELDRTPTRQEALIMLIRLLGEEQDALGYTGTSTFTDLTGWLEGRSYIIYGHNKGYTNGESATVFAQAKPASLEMYLTFVLRALGYSDAAGDFVWNTSSRTLAIDLGLITQSEIDSILTSGFMRDHVVRISYNALDTNLKGSGETLAEKLTAAGVITSEQLRAARQAVR